MHRANADNLEPRAQRVQAPPQSPSSCHWGGEARPRRAGAPVPAPLTVLQAQGRLDSGEGGVLAPSVRRRLVHANHGGVRVDVPAHGLLEQAAAAPHHRAPAPASRETPLVVSDPDGRGEHSNRLRGTQAWATALQSLVSQGKWKNQIVVPKMMQRRPASKSWSDARKGGCRQHTPLSLNICMHRAGSHVK